MMSSKAGKPVGDLNCFSATVEWWESITAVKPCNYWIAGLIDNGRELPCLFAVNVQRVRL